MFLLSVNEDSGLSACRGQNRGSPESLIGGSRCTRERASEGCPHGPLRRCFLPFELVLVASGPGGPGWRPVRLSPRAWRVGGGLWPDPRSAARRTTDSSASGPGPRGWSRPRVRPGPRAREARTAGHLACVHPGTPAQWGGLGTQRPRHRRQQGECTDPGADSGHGAGRRPACSAPQACWEGAGAWAGGSLGGWGTGCSSAGQVMQELGRARPFWGLRTAQLRAGVWGSRGLWSPEGAPQPAVSLDGGLPDSAPAAGTRGRGSARARSSHAGHSPVPSVGPQYRVKKSGCPVRGGQTDEDEGRSPATYHVARPRPQGCGAL